MQEIDPVRNIIRFSNNSDTYFFNVYSEREFYAMYVLTHGITKLSYDVGDYLQQIKHKDHNKNEYPYGWQVFSGDRHLAQCKERDFSRFLNTVGKTAKDYIDTNLSDEEKTDGDIKYLPLQKSDVILFCQAIIKQEFKQIENREKKLIKSFKKLMKYALEFEYTGLENPADKNTILFKNLFPEIKI